MYYSVAALIHSTTRPKCLIEPEMMLNTVNRHSYQYDGMQFSERRVYEYLHDKYAFHGAELLQSIRRVGSVPGMMWMIDAGLKYINTSFLYCQ